MEFNLFCSDTFSEGQGRKDWDCVLAAIMTGLFYEMGKAAREVTQLAEDWVPDSKPEFL
jgi:hypothetical protein